MAASSGILSWVSSTTGVVMPTMYPIAAEIAQTLSGVDYVELIAAITATLLRGGHQSPIYRRSHYHVFLLRGQRGGQ